MEEQKRLEDPMGTLIGGLKIIMSIADGSLEKSRATAMTEKMEGFTVDTCDTVDAGWETGIEPTGKPWIIVQRYSSKEKAEAGHAKWIKLLKEHPDTNLSDINYR